MKENARTIRLGGMLSAIVLFVSSAGELRAIEFLSADSNSDREVSISDAYYTLAFLFRGENAPECLRAADTDGNGVIGVADALRTLIFVITGADAPSAPFPAPGVRAGPAANLACESYGNGQPLVDPAAELAISGAEAAGGDSRNASITLAVSSSGLVGGLRAEIVDEAGIVEGVNPNVDKLSLPTRDVYYLRSHFDNGVLTVGFITSVLARSVLPPGEHVDVVRVELCLKAGTAAGEYPLTLRAGELIAGCGSRCGETAGRAIAPALTSAKLVVSSPVAAGAACASRTFQPPPMFRPPLESVDLAAEVRVGNGEGRRGDEVEVPYIVRCEGDVMGFSFSIDFDETVLQATAVEPRFTAPDSAAVPFWVAEMNNANDSPGSAGVDEGYVVGSAVTDLAGQNDTLPANTDNVPVMLRFRISAHATASPTRLRFVDGGVAAPGTPGVENLVTTTFGDTFEPSRVDALVTVDGVLNILPDVSAFFVRGDANGDGAVNIADPQFTLNYLFRDGLEPPCMDAADAIDDASLNISDPVATLQVLFLGRTDLPEPFDAPGVDPTDDALDCKQGGA